MNTKYKVKRIKKIHVIDSLESIDKFFKQTMVRDLSFIGNKGLSADDYFNIVEEQILFSYLPEWSHC
jgi:hypothetical protein